MSTGKRYIPYWVAVIININIVLGSAFFLGAQQISSTSGLVGCLVWLACGLMLMPLISVFANFAKRFPQVGGLYVYSEQVLGKTWGFVSCWAYFIGTAAGNAAVLHAFCQYFQRMPVLQNYLKDIGLVDLKFDIVCALCFMLLNLLNIEFLEVIQLIFTVLKIIPMAFVVIGIFFVDSFPPFVTYVHQWSGSLGIVPMVLFAYLGIEACCAVADQIKSDGKARTSSVIWVSFIVIVSIYVLLQLAVFIVQPGAGENPFFTVLRAIFSNPRIISLGNALVYTALLCSFLAGFYGAFYFNSWNLYAIGKNNALPYARQLCFLNKYQAPVIAVILQSLLIMFLLFISQASHSLITMSDFGVVIAYACTSLAYLVLYKNFVGLCALTSCCIFTAISVISLLQAGIYNLIPFVVILLLGLGGYMVRSKCDGSTN